MKVVRLDSLTPAMRDVVLALINAAKAKPEAAPGSPHKRVGTASDMEKGT